MPIPFLPTIPYVYSLTEISWENRERSTSLYCNMVIQCIYIYRYMLRMLRTACLVIICLWAIANAGFSCIALVAAIGEVLIKGNLLAAYSDRPLCIYGIQQHNNNNNWSRGNRTHCTLRVCVNHTYSSKYGYREQCVFYCITWHCWGIIVIAQDVYPEHKYYISWRV